MFCELDDIGHHLEVDIEKVKSIMISAGLKSLGMDNLRILCFQHCKFLFFNAFTLINLL